MKQAKVHDQRLDNLRAFAIFIVVLGHSIILYSGSWGIYHAERASALFHYMKEVINLFQMPLFFSLSGYLFAKTAKSDSFVGFAIKKIKRLIVPHLFIGLAYMIPIKMLIHYPGYHGVSYVGAVKRFLIGADMGHLWFLPTLFLFFFFSFWIKKLLGNKSRVWLVTSVLAAALSLFHWKMDPYWIYIYYFFQYYWSFAFGALLSEMDLNKVSIPWKLSVGCAALLAAGVSIYMRTPLLSLAASVVITLTCYLLAPSTGGKLINLISKNSFGIYLFHSPLIYITFTYMLNAAPVVVFVINYFLFGSLAFFLSIVLTKTSVKYLLGQWP